MSVINTNIMSLNAQRHLGNSQSSMQTSMERLSSGLRINSAKDDAAGLAIGKMMGANVASLNQGIRNANDGISMIQTAEGAMEETQVMLQRMKELATQAANGTLNGDQRKNIEVELKELSKEIDNISKRTTFNGISLLAGETDGEGNTADVSVTLQIGSSNSAENQLSLTFKQIDSTTLGDETSKISDILGDGGTWDSENADSAQSLMAAVDAAINTVSAERATLGAAQNRLEHTVANQQVAVENLSAAQSRIMDADFAAETANLTRAQVLQQAGTAMLAQANQAPQNVLSLLR